jgi:phosphosulfolactate synthase
VTSEISLPVVMANSSKKAGTKMNVSPLDLPARREKPRSEGLTVVIDNGLPLGAFEDAIASATSCVDLVKFGWGTAVVTPRLEEKIACLDRLGVGYFFGGTLFEKFVAQDLVEDYFELCRIHRCRYVEISDGTIQLSRARKEELIARAAEQFVVLSEVGYKDAARSEALTGEQWVSFIERDFAAGASLVVTEARESGRSGICDATGTPRFDIVEEILNGGADCRRLVFEAPTKELQTFFVTRVGTNVNLANVAPQDVIGLETLRLGLRSDTLLHFELERQHQRVVAVGA